MRRTEIVLLLLIVVLTACGGPPSQPAPAETPVPAAATAWLAATAIPLTTVESADSLDDLEPLRAMIGNARIVSLGEATHGTDEFFKMKARLVRFLAERMGFTAFAIEATWPEANRIDRFVRTGNGDPEVLLSGLYFWTWNTTSVLDMIRWMRGYNERGGRLGFYGFDMQYPGMALDNVDEFVRAVDSGASAEFTQRMACLARDANDATGTFRGDYAVELRTYKDACYEDLKWVHTTLTARRVQYSAASSPAEWSVAQQSARVAMQYEEMVSNRATRDAAMAENAGWLLDQLPADAKIVLWAHNGHVGTAAGFMGDYLRQKYGSSMVTVGFTFAQGTFTAITQRGSVYGARETQTATPIVEGSYEQYFASTELPRFLLDLRGRDLFAPDVAWLRGPRRLRSIGAVFNRAVPDNYWYSVQLPSYFDLMIYIETSTATQVLPFRYPSAF